MYFSREIKFITIVNVFVIMISIIIIFVVSTRVYPLARPSPLLSIYSSHIMSNPSEEKQIGNTFNCSFVSQ